MHTTQASNVFFALLNTRLTARHQTSIFTIICILYDIFKNSEWVVGENILVSVSYFDQLLVTKSPVVRSPKMGIAHHHPFKNRKYY